MELSCDYGREDRDVAFTLFTLFANSLYGCFLSLLALQGYQKAQMYRCRLRHGSDLSKRQRQRPA
jgi:hypothetical protein